VKKYKAYRFYSDPGHGWLAVKFSELCDLGIENKISSCSYKHGGTVYLEEDCDMAVFLKAYKEQLGMEAMIKEIDQHDEVREIRIRKYRPYNPPMLPVRGKLNGGE
jgi:hypothetical protein